MSKDAIIVNNVSKKYRLFVSRGDRFKEILHPFGKKYHKEFTALDGVNLRIKKGEAFAVLGKNGSGKSTLLQIISSIKKPTYGDIEVKGNISALLELGIEFNPHLSGKDNVFLKGIIDGHSESEMEEKFSEIEDFAGLGDYIQQPVGSYSSGMLVRLAFSVSISLSPDILIVDEALSVGDIEFQMKCISWMMDYVKKGNTLVFVSHDLQLINSLCTRAVYIENGKVIDIGSTEKITELYIKRSHVKKEKLSNKNVVNLSNKSVDAAILSLELFDESNKLKNDYLYGEKCLISIEFKIKDAIEQPSVLLILRDYRGYNIYGKWIYKQSFTLVSKKDGYYIYQCAINVSLIIASGMYSVLASIQSHKTKKEFKILHRKHDVVYLNVTDHQQRFHGAVNLEA